MVDDIKIPYEEKMDTLGIRVPRELKQQWKTPVAFWENLTDSYIALVGNMTKGEVSNFIAEFENIDKFFNVLIVRYGKDVTPK